MTIEQAIKWCESRYQGASMPGATEAYKMCLAALRAQQEAEKNEPPVRCKDCVNWRQGETMGGYLPGELERLGTCHWIRGAFMATDFCSKAKRRLPVKEGT